ncbi:GTP pyrophosphokinase [Corynebacterium phocae]|uniref:GTP pyrophosphokinase n=1 Tax=Corynebacterium phocae TaxID=161895 RepID=A0A1L7D6P8_9CORY|nr:GTP pyrophosphokinase [Corynebacterium phocae]APT93663.1 GTP pyrophosphokinase [Corynebacterium phocae]KAA8725407.1 GTP pyrophosphokinase family protein [Corynebacterium phocae]
MPEHSISHLSNRYHNWVTKHPLAAAEFSDAIEDLLDDAGVVYDRVATRVKGWPSLKAKAKKKKDGRLMYPHPWEDINDLVGARITVYHSTVIPTVIEVLSQSFDIVRSVDKAAETRISGGFGYGSHHLVCQVTREVEELAEYEGLRFEIQLRTVLQHAWAEFEHDIRYKQGPKPPTPQVDRLFTLAAGLIELADQQFDDIAKLMSTNTAAPANVSINADTLPGVLAMLLGDTYPRSRSDRYRFLEELLDAHGLDSLSAIQELLDDKEIKRLHATMRYRTQPGQIRLLDDLLLAKFGREHITKTAKLGDRADRRRQLGRRLKLITAG